MAITSSKIAAKVLLAASTLLVTAACSKQATEYEADVKDDSGEKLIVEDANSTDVPVTLPDTPMTNVPPSDAASEAPATQ